MQFFTGISAYPKAWSFANKHGLWPIMLVPGAISLVLFIGLLVLAFSYAGPLAAYLMALLPDGLTAGNWAEWLAYLVNAVVYLGVLLGFLVVYKGFMIGISTPFLYLIAGKVLHLIHPEVVEKPFHWPTFLREALLGLWDAVKMIVKELLITLFFTLLSLLIPFLAPFVAVALVLTQAYFIGFSMLDIVGGYLGKEMAEMRTFRKQHRWLAWGNGVGFYLLLLIPVLGVIVAPASGIVALSIGMKEVK